MKQIGQPDIQLLGIGENGHIGFNEPGTSFESETRVVDLTESTINANSVHFDHIDDVPKQAVSMGLNSIMRAKRIILLAFGERKRDAIQKSLLMTLFSIVYSILPHKTKTESGLITNPLSVFILNV